MSWSDEMTTRSGLVAVASLAGSAFVASTGEAGNVAIPALRYSGPAGAAAAGDAGEGALAGAAPAAMSIFVPPFPLRARCQSSGGTEMPQTFAGDSSSTPI